MTSPQKENGYTPIANEILEQMAKVKLSPTQYRIIFIVWRYTYGFNRKEHDLSLGFLSNATGCDKRQLQRELKELENLNIIKQKVKNGVGRKLGFNKHYDAWVGETAIGEITIGESDNGETIKGGVGETVKGTIGEIDNQERHILNTNLNTNIDSVFEFWNSKKIVVHRSLTDKIKRKISGILNNYTLEEIQKAINNYDTVLKGDEYFWTYQWTLEDFLQRGMDKFLSDSCFNNYRSKGQAKPQQKPKYNPNNFTPREYDGKRLEDAWIKASK